MPRPRMHDLDRLLDVAERLVAEGGPERLTVRGLADAAGVSNGVIYHAFGSRPVLLGQVWRRAARDFLDLQTEAVDAAEGAGALPAVLAAADAPAVFAAGRPHAARVLMYVRRERLIGADVPADLAEAMRVQDRRLLAMLARLSAALWDRTDDAAVEAVMMCVVDLPTAVFRRELTAPSAAPGAVSADSRARLAAAVRAVLAIAPTPRLCGPPSARPA
ncbi:MAG TPA: helix-turn-helix domain-containing protein [Streptosporangiaceae bacterium]